MRLPSDPRTAAHRLLDRARRSVPVRAQAAEGLAAFDDVPCAQPTDPGSCEPQPNREP